MLSCSASFIYRPSSWAVVLYLPEWKAFGNQAVEIYRFETQTIAPLEFFSRILLSRPVLDGDVHDWQPWENAGGRAQEEHGPQDDIEPILYSTRRITQQTVNGN